MSVVRPATDQDREDLIRDVSAGINSFDREQVLSLIARIDQERARAEKAEAENRKLREIIQRFTHAEG
jgi:hypothetical protein